ncbi:TetR/AcrR family transcriptional regulator C-terminal domain-containing protein [Mycobacteroides abscessus]|uniref:Tetracyclin repressor domain protein n=6 Tax=Mycobacteroides abscessus TaxID=36809 RepID=A0A1U3CKJ3_9MYCO|nr:TetR/AcrR family transcriptional regulator C-terminal domain-containing protein [Mycobacteroides abscessus]ESV59968.1 bacterial regulatory s, tetR family protein [Mycobacteroides abscessus MAB_082312_2258]ESV63261.1 bacterial regulatory s, tetR family protein [Mycobacteroides abscessus MAB_091912_2446]EUA70932.1 bacterial regulatory s, tetR family protein [Mycobacteroides abscessus subsp. bolletii 1513]AGM28678.1 tetracyclin repressor domain protein [Mycobacteroides abscessus subsp. bolletii
MAATKRRHTVGDVVHAALDLLDEGGREAVALRAVAARMGVHLNTVSFQVKTKARLFELMADAILEELSLEDLPEDPRQRVKEITRRQRTVLLARRDGARVVLGTNVFERNTMNASEATVSALLDAGFGDRAAARISSCLHYFLLGLVQEEQDTGSVWSPPLGGDEVDYPALARTRVAFSSDTFADRLEFAMEAFLAVAN